MICLCIYLSECLLQIIQVDYLSKGHPVTMSVCLSLFLLVCPLHLSVWLFFFSLDDYLSVGQPVNVSVFLSIFLLVCLCIYLSDCFSCPWLTICLLLSQSMSLSVCPSICLEVHIHSLWLTHLLYPFISILTPRRPRRNLVKMWVVCLSVQLFVCYQ